MPENLIYYLIIPGLIITVCFLLAERRPPETIQAIATLSGIGGTFLGIIIALWGVDFNNLNDSIPQLLNGIYPAFLSSLTGVLIALWIYLFPVFWKQEESLIEKERDIDSLILLELKELNKNLTGDSEASMSTQLLKLKDAVTTKQDELKNSFDAFAKTMSENNMKALEEVIKDFNTKLQEQFGENFKKLNEAVGKLVVWQENYKNTVEETQKQLKHTVVTLEKIDSSAHLSSQSLAKMTESANSFKENSDALKEQLEDSRNAIGAINEMSNKLDGSVEKIKTNMEDITKKSLEELKTSTHSILQDLGQNLKGISEKLVVDYEKVAKVIREISNS